MKIVSAENLQDVLDSQLIWRRREISSLVTLAKSSSFPVQVGILRASVPLLYAHWEGFSKECFVRYLELVSYKRVKFKHLDPAFLYMASLPSLARIAHVDVNEGLEILGNLMERLENTNKDNFKKKVNTRSNLRSDVLKDLLTMCGLEGAAFEADADFIDREICDSRNEIAHGSGSAPTMEAFLRRRDRAFTLMTQLQSIVVNAAIATSYKLAA